MNNDNDYKSADNNQQPMNYQEFVQGNSFGSPGQRTPGNQGSGQGNRPPNPPGFSSGPPGFGPGPSGPPSFGPGPLNPPGFGPGSQGPSGSFGSGRPGPQPPSAPPNFTPQLPREEQQFLSEPSSFRGPSGGGGFNRRPRNLRGCINRFTYIWLFNGNNFWFYPISIGRNTIEGFRWRRNRWEFDRININRILFHICF